MNLKLTFKTEIFVSIIVVCMVYFSMPVINCWQKGLDHWLMRKNVTNKFDVPINIVYFDEQDIEQLGGWPLTRNAYAFLIEKLFSLDVRLIGIDVFWGERLVSHDENDFLLASVLNKIPRLAGSFYFESLTGYSKWMFYTEENIPFILPCQSLISFQESFDDDTYEGIFEKVDNSLNPDHENIIIKRKFKTDWTEYSIHSQFNFGIAQKIRSGIRMQDNAFRSNLWDDYLFTDNKAKQNSREIIIEPRWSVILSRNFY